MNPFFSEEHTSHPNAYDTLTSNEQATIDRICDQFESKLIAGQNPRPEDFVEAVDGPCLELLICEMLSIELHHRTADHQEVEARYHARFPEFRDAIQSTCATLARSLRPGTQLNEFRIARQIGAGGMGVVYEAFDTKLERKVALKMLPELLCEEPDRLKRFEREAKVLASLSHANIATLHGLEEHGGTRFLVMEWVDGESLAERIARGRLDVAEAIRMFGQIAEALEVAHDHGIIHRDLKPANVNCMSDGKVKVLDFGLAVPLHRPDRTDPSSSSSTAFPQEVEVSSLSGTVPYMSPEQARGEPLNKRTDIWAFGCCLFEAITGQRAFQGETRIDVLMAVLQREPDWKVLPHEAPAGIKILLRRCLEKDHRRRLRDIGDARLELGDCLAKGTSSVERQAEPDIGNRIVKHRKVSLLNLGLGVIVGAVITAIVAWFGWPDRQSEHFQHVGLFEITVPESQHFAMARFVPLGCAMPAFALSPDGRILAYVANDSGTAKLMVRDPQGKTKVISGTEDAYHPFFSPDGDWIGFFAKGRLKKVAVEGGSPIDLSTVSFSSRRDMVGGRKNLLCGQSCRHAGRCYFRSRPFTRSHSFKTEIASVLLARGLARNSRSYRLSVWRWNRSCPTANWTSQIVVATGTGCSCQIRCQRPSRLRVTGATDGSAL